MLVFLTFAADRLVTIPVAITIPRGRLHTQFSHTHDDPIPRLEDAAKERGATRNGEDFNRGFSGFCHKTFSLVFFAFAADRAIATANIFVGIKITAPDHATIIDTNACNPAGRCACGLFAIVPHPRIIAGVWLITIAVTAWHYRFPFLAFAALRSALNSAGVCVSPVSRFLASLTFPDGVKCKRTFLPLSVVFTR